MDFNKDVVRIKMAEVPETLIEKAHQSLKDCAVTAIHLDV
jgi:hypothetical protein